MVLRFKGQYLIYGTFAERPAATSCFDRLFVAEDTGALYQSNGVSWIGIGSSTFTNEDFDFVVYKTASQYEAVNGRTGVVDFTHTTNAASVINSCINAIQPSTNNQAVDKRGMIKIAPGVYTISTSIVPKSHIAIEGSGIQSTKIILASTVNIDAIKSFDFDTLTTTGSQYGIMDVTIRDLSLNGNHANNLTSGNGIRKYGFAWLIENVEIKNFRGYGMYTEWTTTGGDLYTIEDVHSHQEQWHNVNFIGNIAGGVLHRGPHDATASNCSWKANGVFGLKTEYSPGVYSGDIHLHQSHIWDQNDTNAKGIWSNGGAIIFSDLIIETVDDRNVGSIGLHVEGGVVRGSNLWVFECGTGIVLEDPGPCTLENVYVERNNVGIIVKGDGHYITGQCFNNSNVGNTTGVNLQMGETSIPVYRNYISLMMSGAKTAQMQWKAANAENHIHSIIYVDTGLTSVLQTVSMDVTSNIIELIESGPGTLYGVGRPLVETNTATLSNKTINAANNTITATSAASGDVLVHNGTKYVRSGAGATVPNTMNLYFNQQLKMRGNDGNAITYLQTHSLSSPNQALDWFKDYTKQGSSTIVAFTYGHNSDVSLYEFWSKWSGANTRYFALDPANNLIFMKAATIYLGASELVGLRDTGLTDDHVYTFPDADGQLVTTNATQTLTGKTLTTPIISSISNTGTLTLPTSTDTVVGRATTDALTNKTIAANVNTLSGVAQNPNQRRWGTYQPITATSGTTAAVVGNLEGILVNHAPTGPGTNTNTWDTTEGLLANLITTTTINQNAGLLSPTAGLGVFRRERAARMVYRGKIDTVAAGVARLYFGVSSNATMPISDTIVNGDSLVIVGFKAGATNYEIYHNDGSSPHATTTVGTGTAKNTSFHTIEIEWTASGNVVVTFDGAAQTISTDLPAASTNLYFHCLAQNATAAIRTHSIRSVWVEST